MLMIPAKQQNSNSCLCLWLESCALKLRIIDSHNESSLQQGPDGSTWYQNPSQYIAYNDS